MIVSFQEKHTPLRIVLTNLHPFYTVLTVFSTEIYIELQK